MINYATFTTLSVLWITIILMCPVAAISESPPTKKPHIIMIMTDDMVNCD